MNAPIPPKLSSQVLKELRLEIATGQRPLGTKMPTEIELVKRFGVSRPTIREAMRVLEAEGFVITSRGLRFGATVSRPTGAMAAHLMAMMLGQQGATVGDVYTARIAIEPYAARLLAESGSADVVRKLTELVDVEREAVEDPDAWGVIVARFHKAVTELCGNCTLGIIGLQLYEIIESQISVEMRHGTDARERQHLGLVDNTHARLIQFVAAGDGDAAEKLWREHLKAARPWLNHTSTLAIDDILEFGGGTHSG